MKKALLVTAALTLASIGVTAGGQAPKAGVPSATASAQATPTDSIEPYQEMLNKYCVNCHNQKSKTPGGLPLELDLASLKDPGSTAEAWERVVKKLGVGAMPPQGSPTPGVEELTKFRTALITSLDKAAARKNDPGRYVLHRLNRTEYANAIRDLLDINLDVTDLLPSDGGDFGFDNIASALKSTPMLLEGYLAAALRISDVAVGDLEAESGTSTYSIGTVVTQKEHIEGLPLGTRGGKVVRHYFPADGEYIFMGRLLKTVAEGLMGAEGHDSPHQFIVLIDGVQVFSAPVGGKEDNDSSAKNITINKEELDKRMISPRIKVTAGPHDVAFTFIERPAKQQDVWEPVLRDSLEAHNPAGLPRLRFMNIEGPFNPTGVSDTPSRDRIFVCKPKSASEETACATKILATIAHRAFRRPIADPDIAEPVRFYNEARKRGGSFDAGIRNGIARIIASPTFVFRAEEDPASLAVGGAHRISDLELASRLSFFLWSSIPDDDLLKVAEAGKLHEPAVLAAQVKRMIEDRKSDALMVEFTGQWLQLRNLDKVTPDLLMFPDFDDNVRQAFRRETELLFTNVVRNNRSVLELLDADYTFLNERLAKHYGIKGVYGSQFRKVQVADPNRRGLLGQGSFLALTSVANRTSPIIRGKYVVANLLNTPPLPPPPDVPALEASAPKGRPSTVREQLELHRQNPVCASCHRSIDPIGFALENFDAVGQWQDKTREGLKIDSAGMLADGTKIDGPVALRKAMLARPDVFSGTVTEKMMIYALGRGLEPVDQPALRNVLRSASKDNYAIQSIILGIVESQPFQMRTKLPNTSAAKSAKEIANKE